MCSLRLLLSSPKKTNSHELGSFLSQTVGDRLLERRDLPLRAREPRGARGGDRVPYLGLCEAVGELLQVASNDLFSRLLSTTCFRALQTIPLFGLRQPRKGQLNWPCESSAEAGPRGCGSAVGRIRPPAARVALHAVLPDLAFFVALVAGRQSDVSLRRQSC